MEQLYFKRVSPESVGISSENIINMISDLQREVRANVHSLMVIKDGYVIAEMAAPGYSVNVAHLAYSMSKSLTGIAVGLAIDEGKLELSERLCDILPEYEYTDTRFENITVEHLLSMQSGVPFAEFGSVTENEWTKAFFEGTLLFDPGEKFAYNSMNSYMLARIIERKYGVSLTEFLRPRIFEPLKITNYLWEIGPEGIEKGGWGLYMSAESFAKIAIMMLDGGVFEGKQILSRKFIEKATQRYSTGKRDEGDFDYGYHLWVNKNGDDYLFNGMLGQNVWICPKNNLVVSVNAGNNELFQESPAMSIIRRHLNKELMPKRTFGIFDYQLLKKYQKEFFLERGFVKLHTHRHQPLSFLNKKTSELEAWEELCGSWLFPKSSVSILPLFVSVMQNNFSGGIEKVTFKIENSKLYFTSTEGNKDYTLEIGIGEIKTSLLDFNGERYIVSAIGEAITDKDGGTVYKIQLIFPELPNTRMIKISYHANDMLDFEFDELPNQKIAEKYIDTFESMAGIMRLVFAALNRYLGEGFIDRTLLNTFNPTLTTINEESGYRDIFVEDDERANEDKIERTKLVSSIIEMINKESDDAEKAERGEKSGFFKSIFNRIRGKKSTQDEDGIFVDNAYITNEDYGFDSEDTAPVIPKSDSLKDGENLSKEAEVTDKNATQDIIMSDTAAQSDSAAISNEE